jgi:hypothetical protein
MDELCKFRILTGFKLPLRSNPSHIHNETMMDGEVVVDDNNNKVCIMNFCSLILLLVIKYVFDIFSNIYDI